MTKSAGWTYKYTENHWSNLSTTKAWVEEHLLPYHKKVSIIYLDYVADKREVTGLSYGAGHTTDVGYVE